MDIGQLELYTALRCVPSYDYGVFTRFLVICQFFPLYLSIGIYALTVTYKYQELYFRLFSVGLTLNWLLNWLLTYLIKQEPHIQNCGDDYSMPSWHSQHVFFFYTMVATYIIFKKRRLGTFNLFFLNIIPALVCAARYTLGFNTFTEILVGNIVGVSFAFVYQLFLIKVIQPRVDWILNTRIMKYFGYKDHFFTNEQEEKIETKKACTIGWQIMKRDWSSEHFEKDVCVYCQVKVPHQVHM